MKLLRRSYLLVLSGIVALTACQQPNCDCLILASALLYGRVTTETGAPIAGATLFGYAKPATGPCDQGPGPSGLTETQASGDYRLVIAQPAPFDSGCVFVEVRPAQGSALRDTLIGPIRLSLRYTPPLDSLALDVILVP